MSQSQSGGQLSSHEEVWVFEGLFDAKSAAICAVAHDLHGWREQDKRGDFVDEFLAQRFVGIDGLEANALVSVSTSTRPSPCWTRSVKGLLSISVSLKTFMMKEVKFPFLFSTLMNTRFLSTLTYWMKQFSSLIRLNFSRWSILMFW